MICEIPRLPCSSVIEPRILLFHYFDVVLVVRLLPLFVKVDKFLVQQPIQQFEILQTFLGVSVFEPILSSADVAQQILHFVVAQRISRVVLEDQFCSQVV